LQLIQEPAALSADKQQRAALNPKSNGRFSVFMLPADPQEASPAQGLSPKRGPVIATDVAGADHSCDRR
jgi:hypothetical protein